MAKRNQVTPYLKQVERNLRQLPDRFANGMKGQEGKAANRALSALTTEPGPPVYPLRWQSDRQRMAFFASNGFGRGIPTGRTGDLLGGWSVRLQRLENAVELSLINPVDAVEYVQGRFVQMMHLDTGYIQIDDVVDDFFREAEDTTVYVFYDLADPFAAEGA